MFWEVLCGFALICAGIILYAEYEDYEDSQRKKHKYKRSNDLGQRATRIVTNVDLPLTEGLKQRKTCETNKDQRRIAEKQNRSNEIISKLNTENLDENSTYGQTIADLRKEIAEKDPEILKLRQIIEDLQKENQQNQVSTAKVQEWLNGAQVPPAPPNGIHIDDDAHSEDSVSVDSQQTVLSFNSTNSEIEEKPLEEVIKLLKWNEMSDSDKRKAECPCEKGIMTVTIPCDHPYMCLKCACQQFPLHQYCLLCNEKILRFKEVKM